MLGGGSFTLFHVRGIKIAVDWSWFLILFFVIFWMSQSYGDVLDESSSATRRPSCSPSPARSASSARSSCTSSATPIAAVRNGIGITSIQLWIFGGMARMDRESDIARHRTRRWRSPARLVTLADRRRAHRRRPGRSPAPSEFWDAAAARTQLRRLRGAGDDRLAGLDQRPRPRLQPAAGLPDGRRPRRPRDRLVADRQPHRRDPLRRRPRPRLRLPLHRRRSIHGPDRLIFGVFGGIWLALDRDGDQRLGPRRRDADRDDQQDRATSASPT